MSGSPSSRLVDSSHVRAGMLELRFETDHVVGSVIPEAGGKILDLIERRSGFNLLWRNPRIPLARTYAGAAFDDIWCGGWDDVFPTDEPCTVDGNTHHDHGDLWIGPWDWAIERDNGEEATIRLSRFSASLPCRVDKWITLRRTSSDLSIRLRLTNIGPHRVRFMWNQHIAHAIGEGSRIHLPASRMGVAGPTASRAGVVDHVNWPISADGQDLSCLPGPDAAVTEFLYALDLREGWCVVTHPAHGVAIRVCFDKEVFGTPWLWGVFGGWRGHHVLLTEPCTSHPGSLASNVTNGGSAATLEAGATLETELTITVATRFNPAAPGDQDPLICS